VALPVPTRRRALRRVDLPTLGMPTMRIRVPTMESFWRATSGGGLVRVFVMWRGIARTECIRNYLLDVLLIRGVREHNLVRPMPAGHNIPRLLPSAPSFPGFPGTYPLIQNLHPQIPLGIHNHPFLPLQRLLKQWVPTTQRNPVVATLNDQLHAPHQLFHLCQPGLVVAKEVRACD